MTEEKTIDIVRMSKELSISKCELKKILEIENKSEKCGCLGGTIFQVKAMYAEALSGSDEEQAILERWNELSMIEVKKAKTIQEIRIAHSDSPLESEARDMAAFIWNQMSLAEVNAAEGFEATKKAYIESPYKSEARREAIKKIAKFYKN